MIEMVVAIFIFAVVATSVAAAMGSSLGLTRQDRSRSVAANLAAQDMDTVRLAGFSNLSTGTTTSTSTVDGITYTVTRLVQYVSKSGSSGSCGFASGSKLQYMSVKDTVTWTNMNGTAAVTNSTLLAPPAGTGAVEVDVRDRSGAAESGTSVSLVGSTKSSTVTTNSSGCSFFANLPADTYTATLTRTGYVDAQGASNPTQTATVYETSLVPLIFQYDNASTINVTISNPNAAAMPTSGIPTSLYNVGITPSGLKTNTWPNNTFPHAISNLFPFLSGYQAWAGTCADAMPVTGDTPSTPPTFTATPGATTAGTISVPRLTFKTQTTTGAARNGITVTATHASDASCTGGETYTLGTTASGTIVRALPLGTYTMTASGSTTTACTGTGASGIITGSGSAITATPCKVKLTSTATMPTATMKW